MRIAVCDNSIKAQDQFLQALKGWDPTRTAECYCNGTSLLAAVGKPDREYIDIVFLEIYMPGENGMEIVKELKRISPKTSIVFVTISRDHAIDAFSLHVLHYLVKPITTKDIAEVFDRLTQLACRKRPMLLLNTGHESKTVYLDEIGYIQSVNHATVIFLTNNSQIRVWSPLNGMEGKLDETFLKINHGVIVNMEQIEQMGVDSCILRDGTRLDFTRRKRSAIRTAYGDFILSCLAERKEKNQE